MTERNLSITDKIKFWIEINSGAILVIVVVILIFLYGYISQNKRQINLQAYTTKVELINFDYEKSYSLPDFYSTQHKLEKITFSLVYFYEGKKYESTTFIYSEFLTPQFLEVIENKDFDKLVVKCKKGYPEKVMIFLGD